jgi:hypothetical protein
MTSRSETAHLALLVALETAADSAGGSLAIPRPWRNRDVATVLDRLGEVGMLINQRDGDIDVTAEMLGDEGEIYELALRPSIEWLVEHATAEVRDFRFDFGLELIASAIEADRTLGGAASSARIERVEFGGLVTEGAPQIKAASIIVLIELTSTRPF